MNRCRRAPRGPGETRRDVVEDPARERDRSGGLPAAQIAPVGCTPVAAEMIGAEDFAREKALARGAGAVVPLRNDKPGATWDLGDQRSARLSVYLTRTCDLGLTVSAATGGESSSPNPNSDIESLAAMLKTGAPDWTLSVEPPNTISVRRGETVHSTDLRKLLQARLDAATPIELNGMPVRVLFDGWLLFIVPEDARKAVNLSVRSSVHPWAYYDLTPFGLPRLVARFDDGKAVLWALP